MADPLTRFANANEQRAQRHERILAGVLASVHQQVPRSVLGSVVGAAAVLAVYWQAHDRTLLLGWFVAMLVESLVRLRMTRSFRQARIDADNVQSWSTRWVLQAAVAGLLWARRGGCSSCRQTR